ncbi:unnamed protein product, partial [Trichogramma brassicae]
MVAPLLPSIPRGPSSRRYIHQRCTTRRLAIFIVTSCIVYFKTRPKDALSDIPRGIDHRGPIDDLADPRASPNFHTSRATGTYLLSCVRCCCYVLPGRGGRIKAHGDIRVRVLEGPRVIPISSIADRKFRVLSNVVCVSITTTTERFRTDLDNECSAAAVLASHGMLMARHRTRDEDDDDDEDDDWSKIEYPKRKALQCAVLPKENSRDAQQNRYTHAFISQKSKLQLYDARCTLYIYYYSRSIVGDRRLWPGPGYGLLLQDLSHVLGREHQRRARMMVVRGGRGRRHAGPVELAAPVALELDGAARARAGPRASRARRRSAEAEPWRAPSAHQRGAGQQTVPLVGTRREAVFLHTRASKNQQQQQNNNNKKFERVSSSSSSNSNAEAAAASLFTASCVSCTRTQCQMNIGACARTLNPIICKDPALCRMNAYTHLNAVHNGVCHACDECGKSFTQIYNLKTHIETVHNGVTHACNQCGKSFSHKANLKIHIDGVHNGVRHASSTCSKLKCNIKCKRLGYPSGGFCDGNGGCFCYTVIEFYSQYIRYVGPKVRLCAHYLTAKISLALENYSPNVSNEYFNMHDPKRPAWAIINNIQYTSDLSKLVRPTNWSRYRIREKNCVVRYEYIHNVIRSASSSYCTRTVARCWSSCWQTRLWKSLFFIFQHIVADRTHTHVLEESCACRVSKTEKLFSARLAVLYNCSVARRNTREEDIAGGVEYILRSFSPDQEDDDLCEASLTTTGNGQLFGSAALERVWLALYMCTCTALEGALYIHLCTRSTVHLYSVNSAHESVKTRPPFLDVHTIVIFLYTYNFCARIYVGAIDRPNGTRTREGNKSPFAARMCMCTVTSEKWFGSSLLCTHSKHMCIYLARREEHIGTGTRVSRPGKALNEIKRARCTLRAQGQTHTLNKKEGDRNVRGTLDSGRVYPKYIK